MLSQKEEARSSAGDRASHIQLSNDDLAPISIAPAAVKIEILMHEIGCAIGPIEAQLNVLAAMVQARDSTGVVYALRRLKAHWYGLDLSTRDLILADGERLSAIRQAGEP